MTQRDTHQYLASIDGLRAVAVLSVLLFISVSTAFAVDSSAST